MRKIFILLFVFVMGCTPQLPDPAETTSITAIPTLDTANTDELCQNALLRANDWQRSIDALKALRDTNGTCNSINSIHNALYNAYMGYGTQLEQDGRTEAAYQLYERAYVLSPLRPEAQERLARMGYADPRPTEIVSEDCNEAAAQQLANDIESYTPSDGILVSLTRSGFTIEGEMFPIYGANYYPRDTPFGRFLSETERDTIQSELTLIHDSGLNTIRVFLAYDNLFACPATNAIPIAENFHRLDTIIQTASETNLRLIIVLHHDPHFSVTPLYSNPTTTQEQTRFIIERYKDEPAILAWDLRDRGDLDYRQGDFERETVLSWLAETTLLVRSIDTNHPITAGWWQDAAATAPLVDFVSFQFYGEYQELRQEIANLRASVNKPILLSAIGYSTFAIDEIAQRNLLYQAFEEIEHNELLGWMVYMAFDYPRTATCVPPDCPGEGNALDHYGVWNTSYFPKLAVEAIEIITGVKEN